MADQGWDKTKINSVNRYRNRGKYDYQTVNAIIDATPVLHVSFSASTTESSPFPVILPMIGCTSAYPDPTNTDDKSESRVLYLHGSISSRIMRLGQVAAAAAAVDGEGSNDNEADGLGGEGKGMPVCVCATQYDGLVLALTPNHHSSNYRSAVVFGHAHVVKDEQERLHALELMTNNMLPSRWENTRYPNAVELKSTGILRVEIASASAKVRAGSTGEDRGDLKDEGVKGRVWAGVVPAWVQYGRPVAAPTNEVKEVPGYIGEWVDEANKKSEEYAYRVAK